jgi:hypothetical protein
MKELLVQFLSKAYNMQADAAAALFNADGTGFTDDALTKLLEADKAKVEGFNTQINQLRLDATTAFDKGHKKAKSEALDGYEEEIKKAYNIKSESKGLELIKELITANAKGGKDISKDDVERHPHYQDLVLKSKNETEAAVKLVRDEMAKMQSEQKRKDTLQRTHKLAIDKFEGIGANESTDPKVKSLQRELLLLGVLNGLEYEFDETDATKEPTVKKDGKLHTNAHGHAITFSDLINDIALSNFGLRAADNRGAAGGRDSNQGTGNAGDAFKVTKPVNREDYIAQYSKLKASNLDKEAYNKAVIQLDTEWEAVKKSGTV